MKEKFLKMVAAELKILRVEHNVSQENWLKNWALLQVRLVNTKLGIKIRIY